MSDWADFEQRPRTLTDADQREKILRRADEVGPETVLFIERLWREAVQEANWASLDLFDMVRWYSASRIERAIAHAVARGLEDMAGLRYILEEDLDLREERPTGPDRQLQLPLNQPEHPEILQQSGNEPQSAAIPRTGSRR